MTCPHAQTTTLRWLYGELDDDAHAAHVATCADCQAVCDAHLDVLGALPDAAGIQAAPSRRRTVPWPVLGPLLAAAAATFVVLLPAGTPDVALPVDTGLTATAEPLWPEDSLDARLDALDDELLALQLDLSTPPEVP